MTKVLMLSAQRFTQEALEQEATDYLGRGHYERREGGEEHRGYRNGYRPAEMDTTECRIQLQVPQVRESPEPYRSGTSLLPLVKGSGIKTAWAALSVIG